MVFNVLASLVAWFMASSMTSAVLLALAPVDPAPAIVFSTDWRSMAGWAAGTLFALFVYRSLARKDHASAAARSAAKGSQDPGRV